MMKTEQHYTVNQESWHVNATTTINFAKESTKRHSVHCKNAKNSESDPRTTLSEMHPRLNDHLGLHSRYVQTSTNISLLFNPTAVFGTLCKKNPFGKKKHICTMLSH